MRMAVFVLAGLQVALLVALAVTSGGSDAAGNAMAGAFVTLGGIIMGILLVPALILAINRKSESVALTLTIISLVVMIIGLSSL